MVRLGDHLKPVKTRKPAFLIHTPGFIVNSGCCIYKWCLYLYSLIKMLNLLCLWNFPFCVMTPKPFNYSTFQGLITTQWIKSSPLWHFCHWICPVSCHIAKVERTAIWIKLCDLICMSKLHPNTGLFKYLHMIVAAKAKHNH